VIHVPKRDENTEQMKLWLCNNDHTGQPLEFERLDVSYNELV